MNEPNEFKKCLKIQNDSRTIDDKFLVHFFGRNKWKFLVIVFVSKMEIEWNKSACQNDKEELEEKVFDENERESSLRLLFFLLLCQLVFYRFEWIGKEKKNMKIR